MVSGIIPIQKNFYKNTLYQKVQTAYQSWQNPNK